MREEDLKTSPKQRAMIITIAVLMLASMIIGYVLVVLGNNNSNSASQSSISSAKIAEYEMAYANEKENFKNSVADYYTVFSNYLSSIKAYNETSANNGDLAVEDLLVGGGRELESGDTDYLAFYAGWCADGSVFDSSLDNANSPTGFIKAIDASQGMVEGWRLGVVGMNLGGVRLITVPSELAYGSSLEICGGYNKPLKFMVMALANEEPLKTAAATIDTAYQRVLYANNGIDYDELVKHYVVEQQQTSDE